MHAEIAQKRDGLIALCRRHGVARLEVFGSAARGEWSRVTMARNIKRMFVLNAA